MNPLFELLHPYPFEKLSALLADVTSPISIKQISLAIGEPQHPTPDFIINALARQLGKVQSYPTTMGLLELRTTIAGWLERRFQLSPGAVDPESQIIPVAGTREALFSFARAVIDPTKSPIAILPNPFYQIYEGAALFAEAEVVFLNTTETNDHLPNLESISDSVWARCQLVYICSPGNPSGVVLSAGFHQELLKLAEKFDFIIASDECYSEIYRAESSPPCGLLQSAFALGNTQFKRCVVFHSLSKRSNVPGMRSGFVAGDREILRRYAKYRTYHGATLPIPIQLASMAAWSDETHVSENRKLYSAKFDALEAIFKDKFQWQSPDGGFYLWLKTTLDDEVFAKRAFAEHAVLTLPGSYLSREANGENPGKGYVRIALVPPLAECIEAAKRLVQLT